MCDIAFCAIPLVDRIIHAVNSHDALVEALERIEFLLSAGWLELGEKEQARDIARAALAKAKGE